MLNAQQGSGTGRSMSPIDYAGSSGITAAVPQRVFLSHTSDLGKHTEPGSFVAAAVEAVLRAGHAGTDMAYFTARDRAPADTCASEVERAPLYAATFGPRYAAPAPRR